MSKKIITVILVIIALLVVIAISTIIWYNASIGPVSEDEIKHVVEIQMGSNSSTIAEQLKNEGLIKSDLAFKMYVKFNNVTNFQAGTYELTKKMSVKEITEALQTGKVESKDVISITFIEGKNMRWIASKIAEQTNNTEEDVFELVQDEDYINSIIKERWFITDEIKNKDIYYPLEGYLFPDTYQFENKDITVHDIFEILLDQMENKLEPYKEAIQKSKYSVHQILTIASIIENEAVFDKDRKDVSSVIYNRLSKKMPIQSDVTTYYAFKIDMGERDLYQSEIDTYNAYNTRGPKMEGKLPVGPISSVGLNSIEAAINPNETSYLYFVADKNGNVYFTRTNEEHSQKINELQSQGLWVEF